MNALAKFVVERYASAWLIALLLIALVTWGANLQLRDMREAERLQNLQTETERRAIEIMSQTLNGNLMGAVAVLGLINQDIKQEALGKLAANNPKVLPVLESIGRSYDADGVFIVAQNGVIASSWDNAGKPSTNLNVKFRPYYQMSMQGMDNVYAAVSLARGDRSLYFASPVYGEATNGTEAIGTVVARTGLLKVDGLLRDKADIALLLSPQGVVFASNRAEWIGHLAGAPTPERLRAIRELKQFGKMFDSNDPSALPVSIEGGLIAFDGKRFAVASANVEWNDPFGDWKVVLMEDLGRTISTTERLWTGGGVALLLLLIGSMLMKVLRDSYQQALAGQQLQRYAREQEISAASKERLAAATVRMQRTQNLPQLAKIFLNEAHALFGVLQGVLYVADAQSQNLLLAGSYACTGSPPEVVRFGEGLLGQCAVERRPQLITVETGRFAMVRSGLGDAEPAAVLIAPILLNEAMLGVIEVAVLRPLDDATQAQFQELLGLLAMNVEIVSRSSHTEAILSATVAAERLQAEQLAFQQALVDTIPYPVFYKDAGTRFLGFNQAYEKTFAVRREDLIGKRVIDLDYLPEAERIAYQAEDEAVIASSDSIKREVQLPFADGQLHDALYFVSGFKRPDGAPGGLVGTFIDISALKNAEREMDRLADLERFNRLAQCREQRVLELKREINALNKSIGKPAPYNTSLVETIEDHEFTPHPDYRITPIDDGKPLQLGELVDLDELQVLLTNFCEAVGVASAIIDLEGKILAAARWQRACTDFHRANPDSCARCIESDTGLALQLQAGSEFTMYKCKNGMTDAAAPIVVEGRHLANVFIGQFHSQPPDLEFFSQQAHQFGYDETDYLAAIGAAPILDEQRLPAILSFLSGFARMISTMSLARRRADLAQNVLADQAELLKRERIAAMSLAEDAEQARQALEHLSKEATL
ncbi:MAG: PocR ligand-binding domain-containing protein [Rhodocyclaceae bacterium]|nr:PocR ligand-binding domain-containing protein [Rhodocyclaceae bacterium]MDZ4214553.1 PocR ligand-binding domain-containing protein [Rhodocyclaceae bacterium]